ncbi:MAG: hypothetical protein QHJ34_12425 [bacterium]|jgi:hypothetical protein|nr:hypothetical protein [candidate division KSB1 bacterium]MDH7561016.1 hypothetical protein [bacterium]
MEEGKQLRGMWVPFDAYDVFGYLIPGLSLAFFAGLYEHQWVVQAPGNEPTAFWRLLTYLHGLLRGANWGITAFLLGCGLCTVYVCGHVVASLSSLLIDRTLIFKGHQYPYESLLNLPQKRDNISRGFYRGIFFWGNVWLLLVYLVTVLAAPCSPWALSLFVLIGIFVLAMLLLKWQHWREVHQKMKSKKCQEFVDRWAEKWLGRLFPCFYDRLGPLVADYFHLRPREAFDRGFVRKYKSYFEALFGFSPKRAGTNNYWLAYCHVAEKSDLAPICTSLALPLQFLSQPSDCFLPRLRLRRFSTGLLGTTISISGTL